jgi:uncharacterized secreted protein with C-terminal beta-propeller domain
MATRETVIGAVVVVGFVALLGVGIASFTSGDAVEPDTGVEQFDSKAEFVSYLQASPGSNYLRAGTGSVAATGDAGTVDQTAADRRVSGTNVQETGVGEPDILKTDGRYAFYAPEAIGRSASGEIHVVDVTAPSSPSVVATIPASGRMLLVDDQLVVINDGGVQGFDVSTPTAPSQDFERPFANDTAPVTARTHDGTVTLVTETSIDTDDPCPITPFAGGATTVECTETYHPTTPAAVEVTYTTMRMTADDGAVQDVASVVGSQTGRTIYASENAVYLSYLREPQTTGPNASEGLLGSAASSTAKETAPVHVGIVEVSVEDEVDVTAVGEVPGVPLNQFSLSEHEGTLRVATTTPDRQNRLFVLDENLSVTGRVTDIANGQRLTGVRYVGDTAYAVTFLRQDPFHVIDLSDPSAPEELGQVRLPGESRYLHPVGEDRVIGVGRMDGQVAVTLFDASTPTAPTVAGQLKLPAGSTAMSESHHAFLHDPAQDAVVIPTSTGGHVVSYDGGLRTAATVGTAGPAQRAMFVGDHHYVYGRTNAVVLSAGEWREATTLQFEGVQPATDTTEEPPTTDTEDDPAPSADDEGTPTVDDGDDVAAAT